MDLARSFRCIADFLTLSTSQLFELANVVDSETWRVEVLITGLGRCHDFENIDMVKHSTKSPTVSSQLYKRFGILNMFNPRRPNGTYVLELAFYEEKTVAKILCELAKAEGWAFMTDVKLGGKSIDKMNNDIVRTLPDFG